VTTAVAPRTRSVARTIGRGAATLLIGLLLGVIALFLVVPRVTHGAALTVLSGSMAPDLPVGSIVMVRNVDPASLHVGDVATYKQQGDSNLITHRIVAIDAAHSTFTFKGDRNPVPDPQPVPANAIRGKVSFDVPYLGSLREHLGHDRPAVVLIGVLGLSAFSIWQFGCVWRDRRRRA
jgi:signal peptidase